MKKKFISLLLLLAITVLPLPISAEEGAVATFSDVPGTHIAYEAVENLAELGVINGKSEGMFYPEDTLKREEFAKILCVALTLAKGDNSPIFYDVPAGIWYADYAVTAASSGLIYGVSDTQFGVGSEITRQDMAVMLARYLDKQDITLAQESTVMYADNAEISDYAKEAVALISSLGVMVSRENNLWCPKSPATRAETAMAINNVLNAKRIQAEKLGRYGTSEQYGPPYEVSTDDRLAEGMPTPFDVDIMPKQLLAEEDLEDGDYGVLTRGSWSNAQIVNEPGIGYESDGCVVINNQGYGIFTYKAAPGELNAGDYVAFSCMIKGEKISGASRNVNYKPIAQVYDDTNKWLAEGNRLNYQTDTDWVEITNIIMIPEKANALTVPEFYSINLNCNVGNLQGTVYFDNLKLYKIKFHPMDVVMMDPVYKGIVKGEGGLGDISLRAYINEGNGQYDLSTMNFTARITDEDHNVLLESTSETVTDVMDAHFSSATLPMGGDFWAECILTDKATGEVIQKQEYGVHKREADFTTVMDIDEYGRITRNGTPYLPITIYNHSGYWEELVYSDAIDDVHQPISWPLNFSTKAVQNFVSGLQENNKSITMVTGSLVFSNLINPELQGWVKEQTDLRGYIAKLTKNFKDLETLSFYYIWDEVNGMRYGAEQAWSRQIIENNDLDHPTTCAIDNTLSYRKGIYAKTSDILGYDPYPVTGKDTQDISKVYKTITEAKRINPNRPIELIPQGFYYKSRGDLRAPDYEEFKNMCFQAITAGICKFNMYCYGDILRNPTPGKTAAEMWAEYEQVFREIQYLEPIIISTLPTPYYEVQGGGTGLHTMSRRYDGKSYLFTVNSDKTENTAKIYLEGVDKIKGMYSKREYEADPNGYFEIEWDKYETEVFEFEQADYKSTHAELRNFVAANYSVLDAESEIPTIIIDDAAAEMEYRAYISDYATLYINGDVVPASGKISIEGVDKLDLKIVSEDGCFTTEKTYKLQRD